MTSKILNGNQLANTIKLKLKTVVASLSEPPSLAIIMVGNDKPSEIYIEKKKEDCIQVGINCELIRFSQDTSHEDLIKKIQELNKNTIINGMIVQLPLPQQLSEHTSNILSYISPDKDVDGFHPYNLGALALRNPTAMRPCTPKGVMKLLQETQENLKGQNALVIGASNHVGRPMALELLLAGCTVTIAHRFTKNLQELVQNADILISAVGKPKFILSDNIKKNAIAIDIGISPLSNGSITGDFDFETAKMKTKWISPVPGGVGPMTRAMLLENTLFAKIGHPIEY